MVHDLWPFVESFFHCPKARQLQALAPDLCEDSDRSPSLQGPRRIFSKLISTILLGSDGVNLSFLT